MGYKTKEEALAWRLKNKDKIKKVNRRGHLKRKYGMTLDQYDKMLMEQKGVCAVCERAPEEERYGHLSVDHDHNTGKVRGLLCWWCNHKTIGRHNDPEYFYRIYLYLKKAREPDVPEVEGLTV